MEIMEKVISIQGWSGPGLSSASAAVDQKGAGGNCHTIAKTKEEC